MTSPELADRRCTPCQGGVPPLTGEPLADLKRQLAADWNVVDEHHLERTYTFKNFHGALDFTNALGEVAEQEGHHPEIALSWGKAGVRLWTHKIDGLTESDFVLAAKADRLFLAGVGDVRSCSAKTKLATGAVAEVALNYFANELGLVLIERIKHLHGLEGAVEISVTGGRFVGDESYDSNAVFDRLTRHAQKEYGLTPYYLLFHLHASHRDDPGHLLIRIGYGDPAEVTIETQAYEPQAREFLARLPSES